MGLAEILGIVNAVVLVAVAALLVLLLRRPQGGAGGTDVKELDEAAKRIIEDVRREQASLRADFQKEQSVSRTEINGLVQTAILSLGDSLRAVLKENAEAQARSIKELTDSVGSRITDFIESQDKRMQSLTETEDKQAAELRRLMGEKIEELNSSVRRLIGDIEEKFRDFRQQSETANAEMRRATEEKLAAMQKSNEEQLEKMRETVDEKLQKTLHDRITQSFQTVSQQLTEVHKGLGEMQALASNVGDLRNVLSGVKTRGILGELQLGAIMEELLAPEQYEENVATVPGSQNRVEFAIRLPGEGNEAIYLPIDSKFPGDVYHHLLEAYESGDGKRVEEAKTQLSRTVKGCAKDIRDKYIEPPHTTPFALMFLPFEGLYAEVVRMGMIETLQKEYQICVVGPSTVAAFLNSLRMGFRTLAVQKRSAEVWKILGAVKTEFEKFGGILEKARERIGKTGEDLDKLIGTRTRAINRSLRGVEALPDAASAAQIIGNTGDADDSEEED